jgi:nucleotide-binding universal stress UspA family protein
MYDNVIVPFDGGLELRAALAPAADLAWRCNAKLVVVNTTAASDEESRLVLKSQAISMSGSDIDFWVDLGHEIGEALISAATHRPRSIICVASRYRTAGMVRRRQVVVPVPPEVFTGSPVPVLAVGPEADVSRGLPMTEVLVLHDGSDEASAVLPLAIEWGSRLRLTVRLVGVVPEGRDHQVLACELERALELVSPSVPDASLEVIRTSQPAEAVASMLEDRPDAVGMLTTRGAAPARGPLGPFAADLLRLSPRPLVVVAAPGG